VATYTLHAPGTNLKVREYKRLQSAFQAAYRYLPLASPGKYNPAGRYVTVQEWDAASNPLRQWVISGRAADTSEPAG
jgi:hypothetical protein